MPTTRKLLTAAAGGASSTLGYVEDVYSTYLYTTTGSSITINNGIPVSTEGGLVWVKRRDANENHFLFDTQRGNNKALSSNVSLAEVTNSNSVNFATANGFNVGSWFGTGGDYASWTFRKAEKFFDIVQWTGTQNASTVINHNVDGEVGMIIVKRTSGTGGWAVYHKSLGTGNYISLDNTYGSTTDAAFFPSVTSTNFRPGSDGDVNQSGITMTAWVFASDAGGYGNAGDEDIIKCGSYTGTGVSGKEVTVGFEPQFILVKVSAGSTGPWAILDIMRGANGQAARSLQPSSNSDEQTVGQYNTAAVQVTATGFTLMTTDDGGGNGNGNTYIYVAIRRPMKTPTAGTEVFTMDTRGSTGDGVAPAYRSTWPVDMVFYKQYTTANYSTLTTSRLTAPNYLYTANTDAQNGTNSLHQFDYENGYYNDAGTGSTQLSWLFKRAAGFMDVVCYTGNGVAGREISHGLTVAPELMVVKARDTQDSWYTYDVYSGPTKFMNLDLNNASTTASYVWNNTSPAASVFTVSNNNRVNAASGTTYIAYLFATLAGVSKVGSYTGTGADLNVDCGFTAGARFILIKKTNDQGDWFVYDYFRGISAGNDPYLFLNSTAAQVTNTDYIDPLSSGFTVTSSAPSGLNTNGSTYIFLAIA